MKTGKTIFLIIMLIVLVWQAPRLIVLTLSTWDYFHTETICTGSSPIPPTGSWDEIFVDVEEVNSLYVLTDQGKLFIGDEYLVPEEFNVGGGAADLLWIDNNGATFMLYYPISDHETNKFITYSRCRWFLPKGVYR